MTGRLKSKPRDAGDSRRPPVVPVAPSIVRGRRKAAKESSSCQASTAELADSRQNFDGLFNIIDNLLFILDQDSNMLHVNRTVCSRLGYSEEELLGKSVLFVHPPGRREDAGRIVADMLAGKASCCRIPLVTKDGLEIPVETRVVRGEWNGRPALFGVTKDLSALQQSEERFSKAFHSAPVLMAISTVADGRYIDVNSAFLRALGFARHEVVGRTSDELEVFVNPSERVSTLSMLREKGIVRDLEIKFRCKDGRVRDGLFYADPIVVDGTLCWLTTVLDITARKQSGEILQKMSERLALATRAGCVGIWDWDVVRNQLVWDEQMYRLYGVTAETFSGAYDAWQAGLHPQDRAQGDLEIQMALRGEKEFDTQFRVLWPDGAIRNIRGLAMVQRDEAGRPLRMIGTNWDVTALKQAEAAMAHTEEMQGLLMALASQYINIPLDQVDSAMQLSLEKMGGFVSADRVYVFNYDFTKQTTSNVYEWCGAGIEAQIGQLQDVPLAGIPEWVETHKGGHHLYVEDVAALPPGNLRAILEPQGIKSLITVPMMAGDQCMGFVGFDSVRACHSYSNKEIALLTLFSQMMINVRLRRDAEHALVRANQQLAEDWKLATTAALTASEEEARRIGHELHDTLCQDLIGLARQTEALTFDAADMAQPPVATGDRYRRVSEMAAAAARRARELSHMLAISEPVDVSLEEALAGHLSQLERLYGATCELSLGEMLPSVSNEQSMHLIRIVREAVVNAARHAGAKHIWVDVLRQDSGMVISISSDGGPATSPEKWKAGLGLRQMRMRAALLGASLSLGIHPGDGSAVVQLMLPGGSSV